MLHVLATVALCIFIGERVWHYASAWRLHRAVRRSLQWPPPEPRWLASERAAVVAMVVLAGSPVGIALLLGLL